MVHTEAGESATKDLSLRFIGFHICLGESIPFSVYKSQETNRNIWSILQKPELVIKKGI